MWIKYRQINDEAWIPTSSPLPELSSGPLIIMPRTCGIVNSRPALLPGAKSVLYHSHIYILESILTSDDRKISKLRDMLSTPELPHGHAWIVPCATLDAYQRDAK